MKMIGSAVLVLIVAPSLMVASAAVHLQLSGSEIRIEDAKLGKNVVDREIAEEAGEFALSERVYLWMKVTGAQGESLQVTWKTGDHTFTSELAVGGSPWRTWCYKTAALAGPWTVTVADSQGNILKEMKFEVK